MTKILLAALTASAVAGAAAAAPATSSEAATVAPAASSPSEPYRLDDAQMDGVSAGLLDNFNIAIVSPVNINISPAIATAFGFFSGDTSALAVTETLQQNAVQVRQRVRRK